MAILGNPQRPHQRRAPEVRPLVRPAALSVQPPKSSTLSRRALFSGLGTVGVLGAAGYLGYLGGQGYSIGHGGIIPPPSSSEGALPAPDTNARQMAGDNGTLYLDNTDNGVMGQAADGSDEHYFAPLPLYPDEVYDGPLVVASYDGSTLPEGSWIIPEVLDVAGQPISSLFYDGSFSTIPDSLPGVMSTGIHSLLSVGLEDAEGSSVLAGHVNQRSTGWLSDWGYLHRARAGMHIYVKTLSGALQDYLILRVYLLRQGSEFENDQNLWAHTGSKKIGLVTCAGRYIGDDGTSSIGGTLYFPYTHNLVVEAVKVS